MMKKREVYTNVTPLPSFIPRQLVLDILHSHGEIITLNPLVLSHQPITAPRDAPSEEYYSTWYEIFERIQFVPGAGKLGSSKISFRGCFHDVPWGVQTHIYAPMGVDLRHNYRVAGTQPGEPPEHHELGINAPREGLYIREDIEIRCNFTMTSFVKSTLKNSTKVLVDRLIKKAELLDAGVLRAMMENGRLKTINPADRSAAAAAAGRQDDFVSPLNSPTRAYQNWPPASPSYRPDQKPSTPTSTSFANELPGDTSYYHQIPPSQQQQSQLRPPTGGNPRDSYQSTVSSNPSTAGWSGASSASPGVPGTHHYQAYDGGHSRPTSYATTATTSVQSPDVKHVFATELPTTQEETLSRRQPDDGKHLGLGVQMGSPGRMTEEWNIPAPRSGY